jgi:mannitol-1-/sugar-/sorbitol-6-phosphatase
MESNGTVNESKRRIKLNSAESTQRHESSRSGELATIRCSAFLFDLDGVLIDSTPAVERVWAKWAIEHGFDPDAVVAHVHGRPSLSTIMRFLPDADHESENREVERREIDDLEGIVVLPGAVELLTSLAPHHWTIATSCTRRLAEARLRAAGLPIPQCIVTSTDVTRGKPDPEPFLKAAAKLGFSAADCVVCEDVPAGVLAGKAAGARVVALRTTFPEADLCAAGADFVVNSCADISVTESAGSLALYLKSVNV